ncbi:ABC-type dipeptide/oligopeptide/nickel transport system, permease component [Longilinea arvoryzae]|uniref:ABC-type dipeptide/oligopeptide/nickel transport system, permease component n=1 Tax=Longilinea arvoryzae TaxID=360412 RepID=A0A0S7BJH7_9CHLR|nr:ABC transporter permease [Longilinea arvoryzae]GAP15801.1 ABC-type dipeptide/oligopeptide/nickel transport system, permease component [Longilinea arvoryzae]
MVTRLLRSRKGAFGVVVLLLLIIMAVFAKQISPYDPYILDVRHKLQEPSIAHLFGTDELGRDILSRVIFGSGISLEIGLFAVSLAALIGVTTGLIAGYMGGIVDSVIMRVWDTILAFPGIFLAIGMVSILGPGPSVAIFAVALTSMPTFARLTRSIAISTKEMEFVTAERALGVSDFEIIFRTILPNCLTPVIVNIAIAAPSAILMEASLSYLGLGSQPPEPSWGNMLQTAQVYISRAPTYGIFPGVALTLVVLGMNFFADGLQDALDPRRTRTQRGK